MTTGRELRSERRAAEITVKDVAARIPRERQGPPQRMGISRQALYLIERMAEVPPERVEQYREALDAIKASREVGMSTEGTAA